MTTFTPVPLTSTSQGASSVQTTISHSTPLTIREKNNATKSFPTTAGHTWSASTMPKTPTKQESDRIDSMTSIQQFVQTTVSTGTFSNTKDVQKMKTLGNTSGATTVVDTQKTPLLTTVSTHSPTGQQPSLYLKSSKTSSAKASTTMKSTVDNTLGLHKSRQSTTKMFNTPASLTAIIDDMTTATTSPTKPTTLFKTSPHENTTSTQKSQGRHKQLAEHDDKPSDEMIGYIALVSGIAGAVGIAVLLPLIVFGLKSLCTAAKVAPDAG